MPLHLRHIVRPRTAKAAKGKAPLQASVGHISREVLLQRSDMKYLASSNNQETEGKLITVKAINSHSVCSLQVHREPFCLTETYNPHSAKIRGNCTFAN